MWRLLLGGWLVAAAQELHILSHVAENVQVLWLPGGEADGRFSGEVAAAGGSPSTFSINTHPGHSFRFQAGSLSSEVVTHSGGQHDLVILSKSAGKLAAELLHARDLQKLVAEMYSHCNGRDDYKSCCFNFLESQRGIPSAFADKYIEAYSPHNLMPRVAAHGDLTDVATSMEKGLEGDGYGGHLPPDEMHGMMVVVNKMQVAVDLHWVAFQDNSKPIAVHSADDGNVNLKVYSHGARLLAATHRGIKKVDGFPMKRIRHWRATNVERKSKSFARIIAKPGQSFVVLNPQSLEASRSESALFRYPGELSVAIVSQAVAAKELPEIATWDQDELKIKLSNFAQRCGDHSDDAKAFTKCFWKNSGAFPPELAFWWFHLLWTSVEHWRHCVHLGDSISIREVDLDLDDGTGKNRSLKAQVFREKPLVLAISGLATPKECQDLIDSQDLKVEDLGMAIVSGGTHSKSRRTLTRNLYPHLEAPDSILTKLHKRFFQAARGASGYDLWPDGQEPINWLHYKPGYEYRPHCDGGCGMDPVQSGMRVASSLLYCNVAEQGGSTIFTQDTTKFTPAQGDFLFFTYKSDPDHMSMHAACPVLRGVKSTATQWYREGVSKDYTWEDVSDLGQRRSESLEGNARL